jgi:hypothetical protein
MLTTNFGCLLPIIVLCGVLLCIAYIAHRDQPRLAYVKINLSAETIALMVQNRADAQISFQVLDLPPGSSAADWNVSLKNPADQDNTMYIYGIRVGQSTLDLRQHLRNSRAESLLKLADWAPNGYVLELPPGAQADLPAIHNSAQISMQYLKQQSPGHFILTVNGQDITLPTMADKSEIGEFRVEAPRDVPFRGYGVPITFDLGMNSNLRLVSVPAGSAKISEVHTVDATGIMSRVDDDNITFSSWQKLSATVWLGSLMFWTILIAFGSWLASSRNTLSFVQSTVAEALLSSLGLLYVYTLLFYPGFAQDDTVDILQTGLHLATDGSIPDRVNTYLNTFFAYVSIICFGSQYLVTAFIAVSTIIATYVILTNLLNRYAAWAGILLFSWFPLYWNNIFSYTTDSLTAAGYLLLSAALIAARKASGARDLYYLAPAALIGSLFFAGARQNGLMAAVLFVGLLTIFWRRAGIKLPVILSAWAGVAVAFVLNGPPSTSGTQLANRFMAWELVGASRFVTDQRIEGLLRELGDPDTARHLFHANLADNIIFGFAEAPSPLLPDKMDASQNKIRSTYVSTIVRHPVAFIRNKFDIWKAVWGLDIINVKTIGTWTLVRAVAGETSLDLNLRPWLPNQSKVAVSTLRYIPDASYLNFLFSPAFYFVFALIAIVTRRVRIEDCILFVGALIYHMTFMIISPGFVFRYGWLFVSVSTLLILVGVARMVERKFPHNWKPTPTCGT